ncbi:MAG: DUF4293 domain-containing protein [Muribaculaceae bacterium]
MVIQRLQSLYLFIAMVLMAVFAFVPSVAYSVDGNEFLLSPYGITAIGADGASVTNPLWAYFAVAVFVVLFILLTILKFKNLKLQKRLALLSIMLVLSFAVSFGLYASFVVSAIDANAVSCEIKFVALLPLLAVILVAMAISRIKADMKLLSDSDRLR